MLCLLNLFKKITIKPYKMPHKNLEERRAYQREYQKKWRENNPEKVKAIRIKNYAKGETKLKIKEWQENNPEKLLKAQKKYKAKPETIKTRRIRDWVKQGVVGDYESLYKLYMDTSNCNKCEKEVSGRSKHLDHNHETGLFREILCVHCNLKNPNDKIK
jgi:hypothetical protein